MKLNKNLKRDGLYLGFFLTILIAFYFISVGGAIKNIDPQINFLDQIIQATDGSGFVSFTVGINDFEFSDTKLQVEYSDDAGENFYQAVLVSVTSNHGEVDLNNEEKYQINGINTTNFSQDNVSLMIVWDSKSEVNGNGSLANAVYDELKIRITPEYTLPETSNSEEEEEVEVDEEESLETEIEQEDSGIEENESEDMADLAEEIVLEDPEEESAEIEIDQDEMQVENEENEKNEDLIEEVVLEVPAGIENEIFEPEVPLVIEEDLAQEIEIDSSIVGVAAVLDLVIDSEPIESNNYLNNQDSLEDQNEEEIVDDLEIVKTQNSIISDSFSLDNLSPKINFWQLDQEAQNLIISFSELMNTTQVPNITKLIIQEPDQDLHVYNFKSSQYDWQDSQTLEITLDLLDLQYFESEDGVWVYESDIYLRFSEENNLIDVFGNQLIITNYAEANQDTSHDIDEDSEDMDEVDDEDEEIEEDVLEKEEDPNTEEVTENEEEIVIEEMEDPDIDSDDISKLEEPTVKEIIKKIYSSGGYSCEVIPSSAILQKGQSGTVTLSLKSEEPDAVFNLYAGRLSPGVSLIFSQSSGQGSQEIGLTIRADNKVKSGTSRLVLVYEATPPGGLAKSSFCLFNLTIQ